MALHRNLENYFEIIEHLFNSMPYVFWKDKDGKYQGGNINQAKAFGFSSVADFIGKTIFEILDYDSAKNINDTDAEIMKNGTVVVVEETIHSLDGERIYLSQKQPIKDHNGEIIGLLGFAMDITEQKQQQKLVEKEKQELIKMAGQVAHDIRSPLGSLLMVIKLCDTIPERERITLREAATNINDIANNLLNQYQPDPKKSVEQKQPILVSTTLLQLLTDKKYQYQSLSIKFEHDFNSEAYFSFIEANPSLLKRAVSNLVNNGVDSFERHDGIIKLRIDATEDLVKIIVQDNGKGMPSDIVDKIINSIAVTDGKSNGHGIGLTQVREMLQDSNGDLSIDSQIGEGTKIILTFPRIKLPKWIANKIELRTNDIIIILDDDNSIHQAWELRLASIIKDIPNIQTKHFIQANEVIEFINNLAQTQKERVLLLTDYELLKQKLTGLDVIEQVQPLRNILVTSHYANEEIQSRAISNMTRILPKQLVSEVQINIVDNLSNNDQPVSGLVIVDDDKQLVETMLNYVFDGKSVHVYYNPQDCLENIWAHPKNTKFLLDNTFGDGHIQGLELAHRLYESGYTNLYLFSGTDFKDESIPSYLTIIAKMDIDTLAKI